ncbi:uncharacterized protein LOC135118780 [Helicoverpa armigera]|uniref:uncharacterized protein LOC135118780 n=1 Tax=Helicoverpa armigera TaxID=29058 RepID=UPI0030834959
MFANGGFGSITNFDHLTNDWDTYKARLTQWFIANDINDESDKAKVKRKAILLSVLSESSYKLASDLALPQKIEAVEYDSIITLLDRHFTPKRLGFAERYNFYSATQRPGESHTQWAARIRGLAAHCGFKNLEEALLDKFVMGMAAGHEREKLFAKDLQELTLGKAVELAENVCAARKAATTTQLLSGSAGASHAVAAAATGSAGPEGVFSISKNEKCSVCGYTNHKVNQCRFKSYKCKKCNRKGHLSRMCASNSKVNYVTEGNVDVGDDGKLAVLNIKCVKGRPMSEFVNVNGVFLEFEIDSGSAVNVISDNTYRSYFKELPLTDTDNNLFSYTGSKMKTLGFIHLNVSYTDSTHDLKFYVVCGGGPPLLGREFLHTFNIEFAPATPVNYMNKSQNQTITDIISQFPKLFSNRLGCFNKNKVSLKLKPDAKPIFFKARPVAFAIREKIDAELNRLVDLGILEPGARFS